MPDAPHLGIVRDTPEELLYYITAAWYVPKGNFMVQIPQDPMVAHAMLSWAEANYTSERVDWDYRPSFIDTKVEGMQVLHIEMKMSTKDANHAPRETLLMAPPHRFDFDALVGMTRTQLISNVTLGQLQQHQESLARRPVIYPAPPGFDPTSFES